jgi:hypothetical protein
MSREDLTTQTSLLRTAIKAVPAVRYALAVGGLISVVAIVASFGIDFRIAIFGAVVLLVLMTVLVIFAKLTGEKEAYFHTPGLALTWFCLLLFMATAVALLSSVLFGWPVDFHLQASRQVSLPANQASVPTTTASPPSATESASDVPTPRPAPTEGQSKKGVENTDPTPLSPRKRTAINLEHGKEAVSNKKPESYDAPTSTPASENLPVADTEIRAQGRDLQFSIVGGESLPSDVREQIVRELVSEYKRAFPDRVTEISEGNLQQITTWVNSKLKEQGRPFRVKSSPTPSAANVTSLGTPSTASTGSQKQDAPAKDSLAVESPESIVLDRVDAGTNKIEAAEADVLASRAQKNAAEILNCLASGISQGSCAKVYGTGPVLIRDALHNSGIDFAQLNDAIRELESAPSAQILRHTAIVLRAVADKLRGIAQAHDELVSAVPIKISITLPPQIHMRKGRLRSLSKSAGGVAATIDECIAEKEGFFENRDRLIVGDCLKASTYMLTDHTHSVTEEIQSIRHDLAIAGVVVEELEDVARRIRRGPNKQELRYIARFMDAFSQELVKRSQ